jgi:hypothetical protein
MNSNRNVLRPTHNRLPLKDVSFDKTLITNKTKLCSNSSLQQQENLISLTSRPILTATRSIKKFLKQNNDDDNQMLISPMVTTINKANVIGLQKQTVFEENNKTREQLEQDLYEL